MEQDISKSITNYAGQYYETLEDEEESWSNYTEQQVRILFSEQVLNAREFLEKMSEEKHLISFPDALRSELLKALSSEELQSRILEETSLQALRVWVDDLKASDNPHGILDANACYKILHALFVTREVFSTDTDKMRSESNELRRVLENCFAEVGIDKQPKPPSSEWSFKLCFALGLRALPARNFLNKGCQKNAYIFRDISHVLYMYGLQFGYSYKRTQDLLRDFYTRAIESVADKAPDTEFVFASAQTFTAFCLRVEEAFENDPAASNELCLSFLEAIPSTVIPDSTLCDSLRNKAAKTKTESKKILQREAIDIIIKDLQADKNKGCAYLRKLLNTKENGPVKNKIEKNYNEILTTWMAAKAKSKHEVVPRLIQYSKSLVREADDLKVLSDAFGWLIAKDAENMERSRSDTTLAIRDAMWSILSGEMLFDSLKSRDEYYLRTALDRAEDFIGFSKTAYEEYLKLRAETLWRYIHSEIEKISWGLDESIPMFAGSEAKEGGLAALRERGLVARNSTTLQKLRRLLHTKEDPFVESENNETEDLAQAAESSEYFLSFGSFEVLREYYGPDYSEFYPATEYERVYNKEKKAYALRHKDKSGFQRVELWEEMLSLFREEIFTACKRRVAEEQVENKALVYRYFCNILSHVVSIPRFAEATFARLSDLHTEGGDLHVGALERGGLPEYPTLNDFSKALNDPSVLIRDANGKSKGRSLLYMLEFCHCIFRPFARHDYTRRKRSHYTDLYAGLKKLSFDCCLAQPSINRRFDRALCMATLQLDDDEDLQREPFLWLQELLESAMDEA